MIMISTKPLHPAINNRVDDHITGLVPRLGNADHAFYSQQSITSAKGNANMKKSCSSFWLYNEYNGRRECAWISIYNYGAKN